MYNFLPAMPSNISKKSGILVSFIIPTLNVSKVIGPCLKSILNQTIKNIEIIIVDAGSTDNTILKINKLLNSLKIKNLKFKILSNPLKTAEAGKAVGLKQATGKYIALIDSDNILPSENWLKKMLFPLENDLNLICSEPIRFTYRKSGGFIERYSALLGANDPYAWYTGVYDRHSYLTNKWTSLNLDQIDLRRYLKISLKPNQTLPTIGANGTVFRSSFLKKYQTGNYLFDIDIISSAQSQTQKPINISKVKIGIIHTYCESSILKFVRKQSRRISDYYFYRPFRQFNWQKTNRLHQYLFPLYSLTIILPLIDSIRGFIKKPDTAWFFHPLACLLTAFVYIKNYFLPTRVNRLQWQQ